MCVVSKRVAMEPNVRAGVISSKQLAKVEAERGEIQRQLEGRDKSILNLSDYVNSGLEIKDNSCLYLI